jgi:hypothetical protein
MSANVMKSLQSIATQKQSLMKREQELIAALNRILPGLGYRIVASEGSDGVRSRPSARMRRPMTSRRKSIACPHCDRRFAHRLHLGRHISAMHKNGASQVSPRKEVTKKGVPATSRPSRRGRRSGPARAHRKRAKKAAARAAAKTAAA